MKDGLITIIVIRGAERYPLYFSMKNRAVGYHQYQGVLKIGRGSTTHVHLDFPEMRRIAGVITFRDDHFVLSGTDHSVTLNGDRIIDQYKIQSRDKIKIGSVILQFFPFEYFEVAETVSASRSASIETVSDELDSIKIPKTDMIQFNPFHDRSSCDCERGDQLTVVVQQIWRGSVMAVRQYNDGEEIFLGDEDFWLPQNLLKKPLTVGSVPKEGQFKGRFPNHKIWYQEGETLYHQKELMESGKAELSDEMISMKLHPGSRIRFELGEYTFEVMRLWSKRAGRAFSLKRLIKQLSPKYFIVSGVVHALLVGIMFLMPPDDDSFGLENLNKLPERYVDVILDFPKEQKVKRKQTDIFGKNIVVKKRGGGGSNIKFTAKNTPERFKNMNKRHQSIHKRAGITALAGYNSGSSGIQDDHLRLPTESVDISSQYSGGPGVQTRGPGTGSLPGYGSGGGPGGPSGYPGTGIIAMKHPVKRKRVIGKLRDPKLITGTLTKSQIKKVVIRNLAQVRYCYEVALNQGYKRSGSMVLSWLITPEGEVRLVKLVGGTLKNRSIVQCLTTRIKRWRFPKPRGGGMARVRYPFMFTAHTK